MNYKILLRGGEEIILTDEQYQHFYEEYKNAKTSSTLVPVPPDRLISKGKIEEVMPAEEMETDVVIDNLRYWYGTYKDSIKHNVIDWMEMSNDMFERDAIIELSNRRGNIMWMLDRFDKFPKELQTVLEKPSLILANLDKLKQYCVNNLISKYD